MKRNILVPIIVIVLAILACFLGVSIKKEKDQKLENRVDKIEKRLEKLELNCIPIDLKERK